MRSATACSREMGVAVSSVRAPARSMRITSWSGACGRMAGLGKRCMPVDRSDFPFCTIAGCPNHTRTRKSPYCEMHYGRLRTNGSLERVRPQGTGQCKQCGTVFAPPFDPNRLYCDSRCTNRFHRGVNEEPRSCRLCGQLIKGRVDLQFCSDRCKRVARTAAQYGLTPEDYQHILEQQGGVCKVCQQLPASFFHIDHLHDSGRVRGILCDRCNPALGKLRESPLRAEALARYLRLPSPVLSVPTQVSRFGRGNRICRLCDKPVERISAKARYCSETCQKRANVVMGRGLTPEQYRDLLREQSNACRCCGDFFGEEIHVDHRHSDNVIRGLLCMDCNLAAGLVLDDPERALALATYMRTA